MKQKLWKVAVNNWGWDAPKTIYKTSRAEAEAAASMYPASDPVQYAGRFNESTARKLVNPDVWTD